MAGADLEKYNKRVLVYLFYDKHNPTKISNVPKICEDYAGDEDMLMNSLLLKYDLDDSEWKAIVKDIEANPSKVRNHFPIRKIEDTNTLQPNPYCRSVRQGKRSSFLLVASISRTVL